MKPIREHAAGKRPSSGFSISNPDLKRNWVIGLTLKIQFLIVNTNCWLITAAPVNKRERMAGYLNTVVDGGHFLSPIVFSH
jgi:hypothetical protein